MTREIIAGTRRGLRRWILKDTPECQSSQPGWTSKKEFRWTLKRICVRQTQAKPIRPYLIHCKCNVNHPMPNLSTQNLPSHLVPSITSNPSSKTPKSCNNPVNQLWSRTFVTVVYQVSVVFPNFPSRIISPTSKTLWMSPEKGNCQRKWSQYFHKIDSHRLS